MVVVEASAGGGAEEVASIGEDSEEVRIKLLQSNQV